MSSVTIVCVAELSLSAEQTLSGLSSTYELTSDIPKNSLEQRSGILMGSNESRWPTSQLASERLAIGENGSKWLIATFVEIAKRRRKASLKAQ